MSMTNGKVMNAVLSNTDEETMKEALNTLLGIVRNRVGNAVLPDSVDESERNIGLIKEVADRCAACLTATNRHRKTEEIRAVLPKLETVFAAARQARLIEYGAAWATYKSARAAIDGQSSQEMKDLISKALGKTAEKPPRPTVAHAPIATLKDFFPSEYSEEQIVAALHRAEYKLARGRSREIGARVEVPFTEAEVADFEATL